MSNQVARLARRDLKHQRLDDAAKWLYPAFKVGALDKKDAKFILRREQSRLTRLHAYEPTISEWYDNEGNKLARSTSSEAGGLRSTPHHARKGTSLHAG